MPVSTARNSNKSARRIMNRLFLFSLALVFIFLSLVWPKASYADTWTFLADMLATPVYWLAELVHQLLLVVIYFFVIVAQYNKFIDAEPVKQGWVIVRDLCNMFFVIVLLVIAFGTVLKIETYHYKRLLPKFLLMAILINFSKTIAGLFIDFSQIIMLTFVAGFASTAGGNLIDALQVSKYLTFREGAGDATKLFAAAVLALIVVTISLIVVVIMTIILVFRIVALWILVILSPLAYLLSIVPTGQRYASQWWQTFTKYIIVGPVLAFFLWLSLTTVTKVTGKGKDSILTGGTPPGDAPTGIITQIGSWDVLGGFIIGICLLVGSLVAATQMGAAGGKIAGDWAGRIQRTGVAGLRKFTGYGRVADTAKTYMAMRRSAREASIQETAGVVAERIGGVKEKTVRIVSWAPKKAWGRISGGDNVKRLNEIKDNIDKEKDFTYKEKDYQYNNLTKKWENYEPGTHNLRAEMNKSQAASLIEPERQKAIKDQIRFNKRAKRGLAIGGIIGGGVATGGLGLTGVLLGAGLGAGYARGGIPALGRAIREAGKTDLELATRFAGRKISEERESLKLASEVEVKAIMDDYTQDRFTRTAAALEAMGRQLLDLEQARVKRDEIQGLFGGKDKFGNWKNRRVGGMVEATLEKKYQGATRVFEELNSPDLATRQRAKELVQERWDDRIYTLKEMDEGSIKVSVEQIIALKNSTFKNQIKESSDKKQNRIAEILEDFIRENPAHPLLYDAKAKLAHTTNVKRGFESDIASRDRFIKELSKGDIEEIIDKGGEKRDKLVGAVGGEINKLSADIQRFVQNKNNPTGRILADGLNIPV